MKYLRETLEKKLDYLLKQLEKDKERNLLYMDKIKSILEEKSDKYDLRQFQDRYDSIKEKYQKY